METLVAAAVVVLVVVDVEVRWYSALGYVVIFVVCIAAVVETVVAVDV